MEATHPTKTVANQTDKYRDPEASGLVWRRGKGDCVAGGVNVAGGGGVLSREDLGRGMGGRSASA